MITGGSRGLGRNTAIAMAKKGTDSIITYNSNKTEAEATIREIESHGGKALALQLNVGDTSSFSTFALQLEEALKTWNRSTFDFLINNAGVGIHAPFGDVDEYSDG